MEANGSPKAQREGDNRHDQIRTGVLDRIAVGPVGPDFAAVTFDCEAHSVGVKKTEER